MSNLITNYYSIYDKEAEEYCPVYFAKNDAVARRHYKTFVQSHSLDSREFSLKLMFRLDQSEGTIIDYDKTIYPISIPVLDTEDSNFI